MLRCFSSHVSTLIIIIIIFLLIHIITREGSQRPLKKCSVILEWPKRSVLALTNPSEVSLGLDDGHDIWWKIEVHLKVESQIC